MRWLGLWSAWCVGMLGAAVFLLTQYNVTHVAAVAALTLSIGVLWTIGAMALVLRGVDDQITSGKPTGVDDA